MADLDGTFSSQDWIFQNGIKGSATILEVGNSHTTVNEMPLMKLRLALDIPGVGRREVSRREMMPVFAANRMDAGLVLPATRIRRTRPTSSSSGEPAPLGGPDPS